MEGFQVVDLLAGTGELDGLAGDLQNGDSGAAPGVGVKLGEDNAGDGQRFVKGVGHIDGVLTGHGVHHQQDFVGIDRGFNLL